MASSHLPKRPRLRATQAGLSTIDLIMGMALAVVLLGLGQASLQCTALGTTQPLVPSVEDLRFTLGLDNDGDGNAEQQLTPAAVPNWANVVSVRVYRDASTITHPDNISRFLGADASTIPTGARRAIGVSGRYNWRELTFTWTEPSPAASAASR